MKRFASLPLACVVVLALAAVARGEPGDPGIALSSPSNGAVVPAGTTPSFTYSCPRYHVASIPGVALGTWTSYFGRIATRPDLGPDGELALAYEAGVISSFPASADETQCSGHGTLITQNPGTYYWQVFRTCGSGTICPADDFSPVYSFTISAPQPAPTPPATPRLPSIALTMSAIQANGYAQRLVRSHTHPVPFSLRASCWRRSTKSFGCDLRWKDHRFSYVGTATFTHLSRNAQLYESGSARVRRTDMACQRRGKNRCTRSFVWRG